MFDGRGRGGVYSQFDVVVVVCVYSQFDVVVAVCVYCRVYDDRVCPQLAQRAQRTQRTQRAQRA